MSTERLYYTDAYLSTFTAHVVALATWDNHPALILDRSAFYPEGGGQPADHGTIGGIPVLDVQVRDDTIWHQLDGVAMAETPQPGVALECVVAWDRRFDHMQQHLGQHLLTAAFIETSGIPTASFHLGATVVTIDLDTPTIDLAQVQAAEELANRVIWEDRPVIARFVPTEELVALPLRKPPRVDGSVRVVSVPDFDYSACGGTHPRSTGSVGLIVVQTWSRQKGGVRVEFVCGRRALRDYRRINEIARRAAGALSVGVNELEAAQERLRVVNDTYRKELEQTRDRLLDFEAVQSFQTATVVGSARIVTQQDSANYSVEQLRVLAQRIATQPGGVALLGSVTNRAGLIVACAADLGIDAREVLQTGLAVLDGRGGGTPLLAQGGGPRIEGLEEALAAMERMVIAQCGAE